MAITSTTVDRALFEALPGAATPGVTSSPGLRRALVAGDAVALGVAWLAAFATDHHAGAWAEATWSKALVVVVFGLWLMRVQRLYLSRVASMRSVELAGLVRVAWLAGVGGLATQQLAHGEVAPGAAALGAGLTFVTLAFWRTAYRGWLRDQRQRGRFSRTIVLVGIDDQTRETYDLLRDHPELGFVAAGVVGDRRAAARHGLDDVWLGPIGEVVPAIEGRGASGAIVSATSLEPDELNLAVRSLLERGCHVQISPGVRGIDHRRLQPVHLGYEPMFYIEPLGLTRRQLATKRAIDITLSGLALAATLPVMVAAAIAIRLHDGGPIVFRQTRVGRNGEPFTLLKLRTMRADAEDQLDELLELNERDGPLFKMTDDPRVTSVGRIIRPLNIDELPQLWNVLRGQMSLVGPRPALPSEVELFDSRLRTRANVLPGITGLWQVEARDNPSFQAYARLDLFYVENWSPTLDMMILLSTFESELGRIARRLTGRDHAEQPLVSLTAVRSEPT